MDPLPEEDNQDQVMLLEEHFHLRSELNESISENGISPLSLPLKASVQLPGTSLQLRGFGHLSPEITGYWLRTME